MTLLVTGAWKHTKEQSATLEGMGHKVIEMPDELGELPCVPEDVEGVICNNLFLYHPIERFTSLRYIQLTSAGYDRVPMGYIRRENIAICNAAGVYSIPMAEFAISSVLQFYKQSPFFYFNQGIHCWGKHRGLRELDGKTVCIIGCGSVGTECAKRFRAFGCKVVGINRTPRVNEAYDIIWPVSKMEQEIAQADIIILTLPLTEQTHHIIDSKMFAIMKEGCVLVNLARGAIVDTQALLEALAQKELYAALDVFEVEPLGKDSPLWDMKNVLITPHNSFVGEGNNNRLSDVILKNIETWSR